MYLSFYRLKVKPFRITCDPKFLWLGDNHNEALAILRYGILDNRGFLLLTGEVGTGKTLLINRLLTMLPESTAVATLPDPDLSRMDFYRLLADGFKLSAPSNGKAEFLIQLRDFLHMNAGRQKQVLLIIDEAQRLNHHLMEDIRVLSNIEFSDRKLINIFFVGQPEFNHILRHQQNRALTQRITIRHQIEPLTQDEIHRYIRHRLKVAGCGQKIFKSSAEKKIFTYSGGIPRLINIICDHALVTGYIQNKKRIGAKIIAECADELGVPVWRSTWYGSSLPAAALKMPSALDEMPVIKGDGDDTAYLKDRVQHPPPKQSGGRMWGHSAMVASILVVWLMVIMQLTRQTGSVSTTWSLMRSQHAWEAGAMSPLMVSHPEFIPLDELRSIFETSPPVDKPRSEEMKFASIDSDQTPDSVPPPKTSTPTVGRDPEQDAGIVGTNETPIAPKEAATPPEGTLPVKDESADLAVPIPGKARSSPTAGTEAATPLVVSSGPQKQSVLIQFDQSDQIAFNSMPEMDQVADYLVAYPERIIYIWSPPADDGAPAEHRSRWHQRVALVKDYLLGKGAYTYQVESDTNAAGRRNHTAGTRLHSGAMIEFPQVHEAVGYNPDK